MSKSDLHKYRVECIRKFLESFGIDLTDPQMIDTPERVVRMYERELFSGLSQPPPEIKVFPNQTEDIKYDNMVLVKTEGYSLCAHHLVPIEYRAFVGYIPNGKVVGLSKIARIVDWYAKRPQIQELMTEQIADFLEKELNPKGVGVYIEGRHFCMIMRGVKKENSVAKTSSLRGVFYKPEVRKEFFDMILKGG